jgi:ribosomal protein S18 acetylase RimI-like enzyme
LPALLATCYTQYARPYFEASFARILKDQRAGRCLQLVAEASGSGIVGSGQLVRYTGTRAEIADLAVASAWRGHGVGTALIQVLVRIAQASGIKELEIGVTDDNERALALYRRLGFKPWREIELPDGGRAIFLVRELGPA